MEDGAVGCLDVQVVGVSVELPAQFVEEVVVGTAQQDQVRAGQPAYGFTRQGDIMPDHDTAPCGTFDNGFVGDSDDQLRALTSAGHRAGRVGFAQLGQRVGDPLRIATPRGVIECFTGDMVEGGFDVGGVFVGERPIDVGRPVVPFGEAEVTSGAGLCVPLCFVLGVGDRAPQFECFAGLVRRRCGRDLEQFFGVAGEVVAVDNRRGGFRASALSADSCPARILSPITGALVTVSARRTCRRAVLIVAPVAAASHACIDVAPPVRHTSANSAA